MYVHAYIHTYEERVLRCRCECQEIPKVVTLAYFIIQFGLFKYSPQTCFVPPLAVVHLAMPTIYQSSTYICTYFVAAAFLLSRFSHEGATLHGHMDLSRTHRIVAAAAVIVLCLSSDQLVMLICLFVLFILLGRSWGTHNKSVR